MYEAHYGFTEKPFNLTPDPKYLYLSPRHTEACAHLEFGRRERGGFVVITGEVGTGKTTLVRYFLSHLGEGTATAVVLYPALTAAELLRSILEDLHSPSPSPSASLKDLVDALHRFLLETRRAGGDVVLVIDEAQDLSPEVLEQVRLISNLETDTEKLIQIVLVGQSELQEMLSRRELRQLAQRVTARYHLSPLSSHEVEGYVRHRLAVAGGEGKVTLTPSALRALHRESRGIPRLINLVCDRALLAGYVAGTRTIDAPFIRRAAAEVRGQLEARMSLRAYAVLGVLVALAAGLAALGLPGAAPPTAPAAPRPAATSPVGTVPAGSTLLEPLLFSLPKDASLRASLAAVEALWGPGPLERTPVRTHLAQLRRFDLPAVLEMFHPGRRDTCHVALLKVEGESGLVSAGSAPLRVPLADLDRFWTREAVVPWRDADGILPPGDPARSEAWAAAALQRLGYPLAAGVPAAAARFQKDADLVEDGLVGSRTLMALYSLGAYPRPHLGGSAP